MSKTAEIPQHVVDTRYLGELCGRIMSKYLYSEDEDGTLEKVGLALDDAETNRLCDCDPDERGKEEVRGDSYDEDGWFCSYRATKGQYEMHIVLNQARLEIETNPRDFPKAIYKEIRERCSLEHNKVLQAQAENSHLADQIQTSPPPSPAQPCVFPPFPLQDLPPEILLEIVLLAQTADPHTHITLSHMDTSLRTFINSTPLLWCQIDFLYPLRLVHLYLERSADAPLRVTALPPLRHVSSPYYLLTALEQDERSRLRRFMWALRFHRHRIRSLHFRYGELFFYASEENEEQILAHDLLWDGSMLKLEVLDLELATWMWRNLKAIPSSYCIKDLRLRGPWADDYLPLFSTHLKSLIIADNRATPFSRIFRALQATPHLTSLTFRNVAFTGIAEKDGNVLNMDNLKSLSLIRTTGSTAEALFSCIVVPNLVSITLQHTDMPSTANGLAAINQLQLFPLPQPSVRQLDLTACEQRPSFSLQRFKLSHALPI
ncbi:hypothetical protein FS837_008357 [Tulasnella sp. UAMH 9824]|nr:hypothetical protein FS837_008357 [Tulasnella sp. UAMH 9824]